MDPNGENQIVDADSKEAIKVESSTHENQEENQHQQPPQETHQEGEDEKEKTESPIQPVEEKPAVPSAQSDQESTATKPEEKDDQHKDKEIGSEKEKEKDSSQPPQSKSWKNPRKKKNKEEIRDFAQWPTLDEARHTRGQSAKKLQQTNDPNRIPSKSEREKQNQSRTRKGINWKPLSSDLPRSQGADRDQSSATATSGEGEGERGTGTSQVSSPTASSGGSGRGYQGGYSGRGQPRRRGGRGASWPRSSHAGNAPQEGATESGAAVVSETEGKEDSQLSQTSQDSASNTQAGQAANPAESRRYRGSTRGVSSRPSSTRWRGNPRPNYFNRYNNNTPGRGQPPYAPLRLPQDQEQFNEQIKKQIEHYFGIDNLCRDIFLRKNMNNEGWISVHLILNFNRIRDLNIDVPRLTEALKDSKVVEVKDEFIRRLDDWARWTFPPRVEGTSQTQSTPQSQENSPNDQ
jgi:chemotaxis protein histidine kinase CheA